MWKTGVILIVLLAATKHGATANNPACSEKPSDASAYQKSFYITKTPETNIAKDVACTWDISAPENQKIDVYLSIDQNTKDQQCVKVKNSAGEAKEKKLCQKANENTFTSDGAKVTVTYEAHKVADGVPDFKVMYRTANNQYCTGPQPEATALQRSFNISQDPANIAKDVQCSWTLKAPTEQKIKVYLDVKADTKEKQCVTVSNNGETEDAKLCQKANENTFTSNGPQVTVIYTANGVAEGVPNFMVKYKTAQAENSADCTTEVKAPTEMEQSFNITKTAMIAKGVNCRWNIKAATSQKVQVYLDIDANTKDEQCVTVSSSAEQGGEKLCQKENNNNFISNGSEAIVTYSAHAMDAGVPNFRVMYKTADARALVPWISMLAATYVLSQMFQLL